MVYLLHFNKKLHHAQHYIGYCKENNFDQRMARHIKGNGARYVRAMLENGAIFCIVRTWPNCDGHFERRLKKRKNAARLCPTCNHKLR